MTNKINNQQDKSRLETPNKKQNYLADKEIIEELNKQPIKSLGLFNKEDFNRNVNNILKLIEEIRREAIKKALSIQKQKYEEAVKLLKEETPEYVSDPHVGFSRIALHKIIEEIFGDALTK